MKYLIIMTFLFIGCSKREYIEKENPKLELKIVELERELESFRDTPSFISDETLERLEQENHLLQEEIEELRFKIEDLETQNREQELHLTQDVLNAKLREKIKKLRRIIKRLRRSRSK